MQLCWNRTSFVCRGYRGAFPFVGIFEARRNFHRASKKSDCRYSAENSFFCCKRFKKFFRRKFCAGNSSSFYGRRKRAEKTKAVRNSCTVFKRLDTRCKGRKLGSCCWPRKRSFTHNSDFKPPHKKQSGSCWRAWRWKNCNCRISCAAHCKWKSSC